MEREIHELGPISLDMFEDWLNRRELETEQAQDAFQEVVERLEVYRDELVEEQERITEIELERLAILRWKEAGQDPRDLMDVVRYGSNQIVKALYKPDNFTNEVRIVSSLIIY